MFCHAVRRFRFVAVVCFAIIPLTAGGQGAAEPDAMKVNLAAPEAAAQWVFSAETAAIRGGELVLDGRQEMSRAFFTPWQFADVALEAKFLVEPAEAGVLACGFSSTPVMRSPTTTSISTVGRPSWCVRT